MNKATVVGIDMLIIGTALAIVGLMFVFYYVGFPSVWVLGLGLLVLGGFIFFIGLVISIIKGLQWVIHN